MKFTYNWLREFVSFRASPQELADLLTMAGLEVEDLASLRDPGQKGQDWLYEIAVTPNRGDCLGLIGLAREVGALANGRLRFPPVQPHSHDRGTAKRVAVSIQSPRLCPRYSARIIDEVRVGASPSWMRWRLEACGIRSINTIVDIANYVMLETGQPLHAFDLDRLPTRRVVVREAGSIKSLTTLDEVERKLDPEDLLICDGDEPVALAGVMGGLNSEVNAETRTILLESAHFNPISIRRTAKRLGVRSEASHRFERGVDPEGTLWALDRSVYLLRELAGGTPAKGFVDRYPRPYKAPTILLREDRVEVLLGIGIERRRVEKILQALGLKTQKHARKSVVKVVPPSFRTDVTREADLIEELARVHGYQKIPSTLPLVRPAGGRTDMKLRRERGVRSYLAGEGLAEVINLPFTSETMNRTFPGLWGVTMAPVAVLNPLVQENSEMRLSVVPGLLENLRLNLAQKSRGFCGFHIGKVFALNPAEPEERLCLGGLLHGFRERRGLRERTEQPMAFLDCKGLVEGLLELLGIAPRVLWNPDDSGVLHPGKAAALNIDGKRVGYLGELHPDLCARLALAPSLVFELDFEGLVQYAPREITARSLPRFPSVERDLAVVVDEAFPSQRIIDWINDLKHSLIENVEVFDQYRGSSIPESKKSLAYRISYRAQDRTLTDHEVNSIHRDLVDQIEKVFGAQLRS